ncbi:MAG: LLM class flavin-dependent oxidoreductase [Candidatus Lambdaproteobacteria bacterium]|nr:LLM class flavin-dependent oxidoreductase [Candidatus Lambdaproteobacteria bacterium]
MEFGIITARIDEIGYITHAENLGYTHCWVTDSQMLRSNCFAVLALAAQQTRAMKLGTGVSVAGLRLAPVTANGIATINRIAPGRTFLAVGTGNTAMRLMGQPPMRIKEFAEYLRVVKALIRGEEVDYTLNGRTHPITFQMRNFKYLDMEHYIPLYVAAYGPKAQALAGEIADGLVTGIPRGGSIEDILAHVNAGAARSGRTLENFHITTRINLAILEPGEAVNSERVVQECGPAFMTNVHYLVDRLKETGAEPPDYLKPIWKDYLDFHMRRPPETRHQKLHASHNTYLDPEEARFVTADMIKAFCVVGEPEEVVDQLRALERTGVSQILCNFPLDRSYRMLEDFARDVIEKI